MKKVILFLLLIGTVAFGCSKERTCTETVWHANGNVTTDIVTYDKLTPKQKKDIENLGTYVDDNGSVHETICK